MVGRLVERGYEPEFAQRCFNQINFRRLRLPESHAAAFAHLAGVSAWLKCHYPAVFAAALLNSQLMGFYAPAQIVRDAREHGVTVPPVDVNISQRDNTLEPCDGGFALRLACARSGGTVRPGATRLRRRKRRPSPTLPIWWRAWLDARSIRQIAAAERCAAGLTEGRLWQARALRDAPELPLFQPARRGG